MEGHGNLPSIGVTLGGLSMMIPAPRSFDRCRTPRQAALFTVGFVHMIVPCPNLATIYKYTLESRSDIKSIAVFFIYAIATSVAVVAIIFLYIQGKSVGYVPWRRTYGKNRLAHGRSH